MKFRTINNIGLYNHNIFLLNSKEHFLMNLCNRSILSINTESISRTNVCFILMALTTLLMTVLESSRDRRINYRVNDMPGLLSALSSRHRSLSRRDRKERTIRLHLRDAFSSFHEDN